MDLSLDDIIKKNKLKGPSSMTRTRPPRRNNAESRNNTNRRIGKLHKRPLKSGNMSRASVGSQGGKVIDARLKIIEKNRRRLTDAREKLSEIAKKTDARTKIKGRNTNAVQIGKRNERIKINTRRNNRQQTFEPVKLQRSIKNNLPNLRDLRDPSSLLRCTINRPEIDYSLRSSPTFDVARPRSDLSSIKVVTQNDYPHYNREYIPEPMYVDNYEPPVYSRQLEPSREVPRIRMSQEMRARLDSPKPVYVPSPPSPPPSQGHRIVVSNLHSSVTHEDIKELFEDIGPLMTSRLVRVGTAEVIYKYQKDAKKAVEAYHNRQLDGQPMKCLLVNPRPSQSSGVLRSSNMPQTPKYPNSSKSMVIPDLTAIHKALFMSK